MSRKNQQLPDWLLADDQLASNPQLRLEVERARREGYTRGFSAAAAAALDGVKPETLLTISNSVWDWEQGLEAEPIPTYGSAWQLPPTERDLGIDGMAEEIDLAGDAFGGQL